VKKPATVNLLFITIGTIISSIPFIGDLKKIEMLPDYWSNTNSIIAVLISVLCFISVLVLYTYRNTFHKYTRKKAVRITIILFTLFAASIITFIVLRSLYWVADNNDKDKQKVLISLFLSDELRQKVNNAQIGNNQNWVDTDGWLNVSEQINRSHNGILYENVTMVIFVILYSLIFVFLIGAILVLGFYLVPQVDIAKPQDG